MPTGKKRVTKAVTLEIRKVKAGGDESYVVAAMGLPRNAAMRLMIDMDNADRITHEYTSTPQGTLHVVMPVAPGMERLRVVDVDKNEVVADAKV